MPKHTTAVLSPFLFLAAAVITSVAFACYLHSIHLRLEELRHDVHLNTMLHESGRQFAAEITKAVRDHVTDGHRHRTARRRVEEQLLQQIQAPRALSRNRIAATLEDTHRFLSAARTHADCGTV
ncbi:MAG: hypothetical protein MHM6MM_009334, partial [Cercozoa sp. M6MM]